MDLHAIVKSDWFTLIVGIAGIVSAAAAILAVSKINIVMKRNDSNKIRDLSQKVQGDNNQQAGRDIK